MTRTSCEFWRDAAVRELYTARNVKQMHGTIPEYEYHLDEAAKCMVASYHCHNHPQSFGI